MTFSTLNISLHLLGDLRALIHRKYQLADLPSPRPGGWSFGLPAGVVGRFDHTLADRVSDYLSTVLHVQLVQNIAQVVLDRVLGHHQPLCELAVSGDALDQQVQHLAFALG